MIIFPQHTLHVIVIVLHEMRDNVTVSIIYFVKYRAQYRKCMEMNSGTDQITNESIMNTIRLINRYLIQAELRYHWNEIILKSLMK